MQTQLNNETAPKQLLITKLGIISFILLLISLIFFFLAVELVEPIKYVFRVLFLLFIISTFIMSVIDVRKKNIDKILSKFVLVTSCITLGLYLLFIYHTINDTSINSPTTQETLKYKDEKVKGLNEEVANKFYDYAKLIKIIRLTDNYNDNSYINYIIQIEGLLLDSDNNGKKYIDSLDWYKSNSKLLNKDEDNCMSLVFRFNEAFTSYYKDIIGYDKKATKNIGDESLDDLGKRILKSKDSVLNYQKQILSYFQGYPDYTFVNQEGTAIKSDEKVSKDSNNDYILKESNTKQLTYSDIKNLDVNMLTLAKNEIFARHGYVFDTPEIRKYFESKEWYMPTAKSNSAIILSAVETYNINYLGKMKEILLSKANGYE